ncbi:hypothetical protein [Desulfobacter sp. UBA2225]|uniref:hypothetical protein n=1 Tax=Desulfobacter sp. UBA2225 TaxID=1961413 RepID=UPI00257F6665|nr:hypothetical protein [Desulfobacter sp. UBA2225]
MAVGWVKDGAVQEEIDAGVADAVKRARSRLGKGKSRTHCEWSLRQVRAALDT